VNKYTFSDCNCQIDIIDEKIKECDGLPGLYIDYNNLNKDCVKTWDLFAKGKTKGVFQLEKNLGKHWSKLVHPTSIEYVSALISILRPGVLAFITNGKSMAQHYVDRRNGLENIEYIHPALEQILGSTYGIICFQEQCIRIASIIAGFNLQEADSLRKACGKKDAKLMLSLENKFVDGCEKTGLVDREIGIELFDNIKKSNRYAFNLSHSVGYGEISYWTAYAKAHFPLQFCCSYLYYAREKMKPQEEVEEIILDAKDMNIDILTPDLNLLFNGDYGDFSIFKGKINFGVRNIKGCGDSHVDKMIKIIEEGQRLIDKSVKDWSWTELMFLLFLRLNKTIVNGLISVGGVSHLGLSRQKMLHDYNLCSALDVKDLAIIQNNIKSLSSIEDCISLLHKTPKLHKARIAKYLEITKGMNETPFAVDDPPAWIAEKEQHYLGTSISCLKCDTVDQIGNTTCKEFNDGKAEKNMSIVGELKSIREFLIKNGNLAGQKMCFGTIEDSSGRTDFSLSPKEYQSYLNELFKGNIVMMTGGKGKNSNFQVKKVISV